MKTHQRGLTADLNSRRMEDELEIIQYEEKINKQINKQINKNDKSLRDLCDFIKHINILEVPGKRDGKEQKEIGRNNSPQICKLEETHEYTHPRILMNYKQGKLRKSHITVNLLKPKDKEGIGEAVREKQFITYKGSSIRLKADFPSKTMSARRQWDDMFKVLKEKKLPSKNSVSVKTIFQE